MSFLSTAAPFVIVAVLLAIESLCQHVYRTQGNNWEKLSGVQNTSLPWGVNVASTTTPWPTLGQRRNSNRPNENTLNVPTWVRPVTSNNNPRPSNSRTVSFANQGNTNIRTPGTHGNNRQNYGVENITPQEVKDDDLRQFSEELLTKDVNNAAQFVTINVQSKTTSRSNRDEAPLPLLSINQEALKIPSIEKLLLLHNNYIIESNVNENYTPQEKNEESNLLDTIINTPIMVYTRNFLLEKGFIGRDAKQFRDLLQEIWFNMYSRGNGKIGSSGFEHVFIAEIKNSQISGLHNWLYFNEEEKNNRANYLGYMKKIDLGNKGAILKYHFTFRGIDKPVGSMFIGTSPEFEIALYTTCFVLRADKVCPLKLNGNRFIIRTFTYRYRGKNMIGSAFPEI